MNVVLLYLHVVAKGYPEASPPEYYLPFSQRFIDTYRKFYPGAQHDLYIVCCGGGPNDSVTSLYRHNAKEYITYTGAGSDIGAFQFAAQRVPADFVVCLSTPVYFWRDDWLKRLVDAREHFGDGLYGAFASYQNSPHIRTSCWAFDPKTFAQYPDLIDTREKCCCAESHRTTKVHQISDWFAQTKPVLCITWGSADAKPTWRSHPNIFRRGDQTNCLVFDQHCDYYLASHYHERCLLERMADIDESDTALLANPEKV